jgi:hypothetical protein
MRSQAARGARQRQIESGEIGGATQRGTLAPVAAGVGATANASAPASRPERI